MSDEADHRGCLATHATAASRVTTSHRPAMTAADLPRTEFASRRSPVPIGRALGSREHRGGHATARTAPIAWSARLGYTAPHLEADSDGRCRTRRWDVLRTMAYRTPERRQNGPISPNPGSACPCRDLPANLHGSAESGASRRQPFSVVLGLSRLCKPEVAGSIPARSIAQQSQNGGVVKAWPTLRGYEMATPGVSGRSVRHHSDHELPTLRAGR